MATLGTACLVMGWMAQAVAAQTTVTMTAATPIATLTRAAGGDTFEITAQGQTIGSFPNNVFQSTSQSPAGNWLSASTIVYPTQPFLGGVGLNFFERATVRGAIGDSAGSSASANANGATFAPHAVLATFSAAPGTVGSVVVSWNNNLPAAGPNGSARCRVDVDNDGIFEVDQSAADSITIPYTIGASGTVDVRIENECRSDGDGSGSSVYTWTELWVGFRPVQTAACTFTNYGQGCAGVQLAGSDLVVGGTRTILMLGTGCFPSNPVVVAIGSQQANLPLPTGCSILGNALSLELALADAAGNATVSWNLPVSSIGTSYVQFLPVANQNGLLALRASNGVRIDCN